MAPAPQLTARIVRYCLFEEAVGLSMYYDSAGIETWAGGVASTSGFDVAQYKDKPQSLDAGLRATISMMQAAFLPAIARDFAGFTLSDNQLAAVISFNWRNGPNTTRHAEWVAAFKAGKLTTAKQLWMEWTDHGVELARAVRERDLFFDDVWPASQLVRVFTATGPKYLPVGGTLIDVTALLQEILGTGV